MGMATESMESDKGIGLAVLLTALGLVGAGLTYQGAGEELSGWGFALAMVAGMLLVAAIQAFN